MHFLSCFFRINFIQLSFKRNWQNMSAVSFFWAENISWFTISIQSITHLNKWNNLSMKAQSFCLLSASWFHMFGFFFSKFRIISLSCLCSILRRAIPFGDRTDFNFLSKLSKLIYLISLGGRRNLPYRRLVYWLFQILGWVNCGTLLKPFFNDLLIS